MNHGIMMRFHHTVFVILGLFTGGNVTAQMERFKPGPTIPGYGLIADVPGAQTLPADAHFKISFDVAKPGAEAAVNRQIDSTARFINMHTAAGVPVERIQLAVVIHGGAVKDVAQATTPNTNPNAPLIEILQQHGVKFYVCGQSAAYYGVGAEDLLPGVELSLSAMTAHALLQQQGYTLNPF
ncbi:DsrE family protein [Marinicella meishanensis]|uniref:DsrE family protein n=1 Tax=Marinicella meishanensis TaxID=2873263 RepID=UPI001CBB1535|nr:DsrE family protein [Marinicella sp. NBU2979]